MAKQDRHHRCKVIVLFLFLALAFSFNTAAVFAADDDSEQSEATSEKMNQSVAGKRATSPEIIIKEQIAKYIPKPALPDGLTLIKQVNVVGSTILAPQAIEALKRKCENRQLTARMIQHAADLVTRAYAREGYITSYGYIDPKELNSGILNIVVKEGRTGKVTIEGNQNFSNDILEKKITLKEGGLFNFQQLNLDVFRVNKHPDRKMKITCDPNVQTGYTDVVLTVKDKSPFHVMLQYDNYGSEDIGYRRYKTFFTYNNLTGHDDSLQWKIQMSESGAHKLTDLDYYIPLNPTWKFNFYLMPYKKEVYLGADNKTKDFEKHAWKWYFFFKQYLVNDPDCELISSYGFMYKQINWYQYGARQAQDHFRSLEWVLDLNRADKYGRWVVNNMFEQGIPSLMGGADSHETRTSVAGAHGQYTRNHLTVARRQKVWNGIDFVTKGHWQESSERLTGVNVFSLGGFMGVIDSRGYPRAQFPGDRGRSLSAGFSVPPFGISRTAKVPGSKTTWYDDIRFFNFVDYAIGLLKRTPDGDDREATLVSAGLGVTFNVPDKNLSMRLDVGWPVSNDEPNDGDGYHILYSITKGF
jgi:hemolysin activation/secretion protein